MDLQKLSMYSNFVLGGAVIFVWTVMCTIMFVMWISSQMASKKFFKAALRSILLSSNTDTVRDSIQNEFEVYRNHGFLFKKKTIIELCQELGRKLKLKADIESKSAVMILENVISLLKDEYRFDDDKMNDTIKEIECKAGLDEARKVREYLIRLNAYHQGIIYEKDRYFKDMQEKFTRKKWISSLGYILGLVGSVASIYSLFF